MLKLTEWPIRIFSWIADRLLRGNQTAAAVQGALLGVGAILVVAKLTTKELPTRFAVAGWAMLAGGLGATLLRNWIAGLLALVAATALVLLTDRTTYATWAVVAAALLWFVPRIGRGLMSIAFLGLAVWWTAERPDLEAVRAVPFALAIASREWIGNPEAIEKARMLVQVSVPALLIAVIVLAANSVRLIRRHFRTSWP